jgi:hypothetical protein
MSSPGYPGLKSNISHPFQEGGFGNFPSSVDVEVYLMLNRDPYSCVGCSSIAPRCYDVRSVL